MGVFITDMVSDTRIKGCTGHKINIQFDDVRQNGYDTRLKKWDGNGNETVSKIFKIMMHSNREKLGAFFARKVIMYRIT